MSLTFRPLFIDFSKKSTFLNTKLIFFGRSSYFKIKNFHDERHVL